MHGYHGRYLRFDLSTGTGRAVDLPASVLRRYVGGVGLGTWLLHRESSAGVGALTPEAPLVFCFSPLVGTPLTTSAKFAVVAKSPLTGMLCDALSSSHFAIDGKRLGYDALVFVGACSEPSVWDSGDLTPTDLWGCSAAEAETRLRDRGRVAAIGVAGENLVAYATISNDGRHAGRGGLGAVMGAKRLKAIVVRGDQRTSLADPQGVVDRSRDLSKRSLGPATAKYRELGTVSNLLAFNRLSALPTRNFQSGSFNGAEQVAAVFEPSAGRATRRSCASCTIGCERLFSDAGGGSTRMEYENLFALGPLCGVSDPEAIIAASRRCDELGLDTISAGGTIAFAMECAERGDLDHPIRFGDAEGLLELLEDIAHRRGVGNLLAEGSRRAAMRIGNGTLDFAPQVKGLEMPGYEPRALQTMALGFAVGTRGADHNRSAAYEVDFSKHANSPSAAELAVDAENRAALMDSLILCKFVRRVFGELYADSAAILRDVTGWDFTADELADTASRIVALKKAFNIREGWTPADDTLPRRILEEGARDGGDALGDGRLRAMIRTYNLARGWTEDGYLGRPALADLAADC